MSENQYGEYIGALESALMFEDGYEDDDDSDEDPTFEDPKDGGSKLGKRKRDGVVQAANLSWMNKSPNKTAPTFQGSQGYNQSPKNSLHASHYSAPTGFQQNLHQNQLTQSSPSVSTKESRPNHADAFAAETKVKQFLFEHFQRVSMGSYPREASMAILKQKMKVFIQALGRIQARAASKGSPSQVTSRKLQGIGSRGNFGGNLGYVGGVDNKPNPPLIKQKLNMEMASSLLRQGDGSTMNAFQDFESEANKVTEEELERMSELDRRIYLTLKHCESISIRLRKSLQANLQVLLESNSLPSASDQASDQAPTDTNGSSSGVSNWLPSAKGTDQEKGENASPTAEEKEETRKANEHIVREQPNILQLALKEYQLVGLNWLNLLNKEGVNGILADEMGLGKTIQTISLLALLYEREVSEIPHLIICPSTTLANWLREIYKWCPVFKVIAYYGSPVTRPNKANTDEDRFDIIVTTYNIAGQKKDRLFLKKREFNYVILDEAQNIKNNQSLRHKYLRKLDSRHRLLLTGTPLQNNLDELWALLQFIMPDLFDFDIDFQNEENSGMNDERVNRMKAIMAPFVLRRLKQHVSRDLPPKTESVQLCDMTNLQKELYISCIQQSRSWWEKLKNAPVEELEVADAIADDSENLYNSDTEEKPEITEPPKRKRGRPRKNVPPPPPPPERARPPPPRSSGKTLNNIFMQLRKIANHPLLVRTYYTDETLQTIGNYLLTLDENRRQRKDQIMEELYDKSDFRIHQLCKEKAPLSRFMLSPQQLTCSGKIELMQSLLQKLHAEGHRVLIFSQMTRVLDILQEVLGLWGYEHLRLDGSTPVATRQDLIDRFNNDDQVFIFLLSTRAGGVGINLTTADTVIFYDIAFNPQVDRQAEDRCHRFGQEKPVTIYKLITSRTVDQNMLQMAERKAKLNDIMLEEGSKKRDQ
eukprot:CAMPEP_0117015140 /NCGR_PEP_ID=MMETSP0472-20121206/12152_1 /TAXON_ID=693140 ORGANISM="Tiarina fusus, Strain LIS" /NCGR_SAMPLE_ID=MMETSP0472 /ASSEMBLY_ACC=CAM_ASM_000603 /LENGTH=931 /DNA_ID=CAMNT_0004718875 /DNA_START=70 /DNA_END=2864 /DNA_ORIENTATION=+